VGSVRVAFVLCDGAAAALCCPSLRTSIIGEFWHLQPLFTPHTPHFLSPLDQNLNLTSHWPFSGGLTFSDCLTAVIPANQPAPYLSVAGKILPAIWPSSLASRHLVIVRN